MRHLLAAAFLLIAAPLVQADVEQQYNASCTFCHSTGAAGAPKTGDQAAWAPRLEKGMEALVKSARNGVGGMPPMGMCNACTDEDFEALIKFMSKGE